jgi:hypothetical protein
MVKIRTLLLGTMLLAACNTVASLHYVPPVQVQAASVPSVVLR